MERNSMYTLRDNANFGLVQMIDVVDFTQANPNLMHTLIHKPALPMQKLYVMPCLYSYWVKTTDYGYFGDPPEKSSWLQVKLDRGSKVAGDYGEIQVDVSRTPELAAYAWVRPFVTLIPNGDAKGQHVGQHPKGAWIMPKAVWDAWLVAAKLAAG